MTLIVAIQAGNSVIVAADNRLFSSDQQAQKNPYYHECKLHLWDQGVVTGCGEYQIPIEIKNWLQEQKNINSLPQQFNEVIKKRITEVGGHEQIINSKVVFTITNNDNPQLYFLGLQQPLEKATLDANSVLNDGGELLSLGDADVHIRGDHTETGLIQVQNDAVLNVDGTLTNKTIIQAGGKLSLAASHLDNQATAEISAGQNHIKVNQSLTNRGLIDGGETFISANKVDNLGEKARIYGDHVAIQANSLTNDVEHGQAATIAAREQLDLGVQQLVNREHGLIFSAGDIAIGGKLDANHQATGSQVGSLDGSVSIQAGGNYTQQVADVLAGKDINIEAKQVSILTDYDYGQAHQDSKDVKIGSFSKVSSPLLDLVNSTESALESKADGRVQALQGMAAAAQGYNA